jgi:hypothetical protein
LGGDAERGMTEKDKLVLNEGQFKAFFMGLFKFSNIFVILVKILLTLKN